MVSKNLASKLGLTFSLALAGCYKFDNVRSNYTRQIDVSVQENSGLYGKKALVLYETRDGPSLGKHISKPVDEEIVSKVGDALRTEGAYVLLGGVFRPQSIANGGDSSYRQTIDWEFGPKRGNADVVVIADRNESGNYEQISHRDLVYGLFSDGDRHFKIKKLVGDKK